MAEPRTQDQLFDSRLVTRFIDKGIVAKKDYEAFIKKSPDLSEELVTLDVVTEGDEEDIAEA